MTVGRNQRRRAAFVDEVQSALEHVKPRGDQHETFLVAGDERGEFVALGYHDLLHKLAAEVAGLRRGHSLTISLPPTKHQRAIRRNIREGLGLTGAEFLDPKSVPHDA